MPSPPGAHFPRRPDMNTTPIDLEGVVLSATMSATVTYRSGRTVASATSVQTGFIPHSLYMSTPPGMIFPSKYPPRSAQRNGSHSRNRRNRHLSDAEERMRNLGIMLKTGSEDRRGRRARAVSDVGNQAPVIPTKMCRYHPGNHWYSSHKSEPHEVMPYGMHGQSTPPYDFVTFNETFPCDTSAMTQAQE